jgi:PIN domain nuclease of toxin-antitoxin system
MVLDASALLALVNAERGADVVAAALGEAAISAVNLAEVVTKLIDIGVPAPEAWSETASLVPVVVDFGPELANATARLRAATRRAGLSLGDRACLALAESLQQPALTTDRAWQGLSLGIEIRLIR